MPLNENAKLSDVISALSDMQGINQKSELASVIGEPVTASDNMATQITKLQTAKNTLATNIASKGVEASQTDSVSVLADKIGQIVTGKRWATGVTNSSSSNSTFTSTNGDASFIPVTVSNLSFKPTTIFACVSGATNDNGYFYYNSYQDNASLFYYNNNWLRTVFPKSNLNVSSSGFTIPIGISSHMANKPIRWIVFE